MEVVICPECGGRYLSIGDSRDYYYYCLDCKKFVFVDDQHNSDGDPIPEVIQRIKRQLSLKVKNKDRGGL